VEPNIKKIKNKKKSLNGVPFFMFVLLSKSFYIYGVDAPISDSIIRFALYTVPTRAPGSPG
jgi:hypothetical protein